MKQFIRILCFVILILFTCMNSALVVSGASDGLHLWYSSLVPVILPFLLISGLFTASIDYNRLSASASILVLIVCGIFCGYPIGAVTAGKLYDKNAVSYKTACALLPLCNNVSPMFLYGFIHKNYTGSLIPFTKLIFCIYAPQLLYAFILILYETVYGGKKNSYSNHFSAECAASDMSENSILDTAVHTITIIGMYVIIFSIIDNILSAKLGNNIYITVFTCFLEITKGCGKLFSMNIPANIKTALILSLVSFGGISAIFQSIHLLKKSKLSFIHYVCGKLICSILTFLLVYTNMIS